MCYNQRVSQFGTSLDGMGILSVGGPQNMLSLSDKRLALVYAAALEVFKRTGRITICSWYGDIKTFTTHPKTRMISHSGSPPSTSTAHADQVS